MKFCLLADAKNIFLVPQFQRICYNSAIVFYTSILVFGSVPGARSDIGQYASGGVLHSVAYSTLLFLIFAGSSGSRSARALKSVLTVMAMGALDEYVQSFFPYRGADVMDWVVDVIAGIVTAAMLWILWPTFIESEHELSRRLR